MARLRLVFGSVGLLFSLVGCQPDTQEPKAVDKEASSDQEVKAVESTKAPNVQVLAERFVFGGQHRRVWVYLPPDYEVSGQRYSVLYLQDGQNLFDAATSFAGEWEVDETLNRLAARGAKVPIVVGIDHGGDSRTNELSPWTNQQYGPARGEAYLNFIIDDVKPYIDTHFRTLPDVANTAIGGSSMGGLLSHYGIVARPDVFSKALIFSPSFWYSSEVYVFTEANPLPAAHRLYYAVGEGEDRGMVNGVANMALLLRAQQHPEAHLKEVAVEGAQHNEAFWRSQLNEALIWLEMVEENNE
ncbi:alpha/beta hydrolase [Alteromonas aestuariivivens]|uniref:Alpha/beta hydrolase n=2 Tax=Alteromonas aestuariivivens TaxID=1938339 RepID=A0A3D8M8P4_9ALTE|nr:alpha/beta hydrolase [Alteromonas aestuariivivens]